MIVFNTCQIIHVILKYIYFGSKNEKERNRNLLIYLSSLHERENLEATALHADTTTKLYRLNF